jgi:Tfp pilus assembly protein PilF
MRGRASIISIIARVLALAALILATSCGLPRIVVLNDPLSPEEHLNLGVAYENKGELDLAISEYKVASKAQPLGYLYLGNAYFRKGEMGKAEKYYRKALKEMPDNADAHNNLAWLYYTKRENLDEAESHALRAMELDPSKGDVYADTLDKIRALEDGGR